MPNDVDGNYVSQRDAVAAWAPVAREAMLTTASRYREVITYKELAAQVHETSGITTTQRLDYWIGGLLENVAIMSKECGEPPLTSLCVHQDGTIGPGYARAPKLTVNDDPDADVDDLAAHHRLLCYRAYAADLPTDGGVAAHTPQVAAARARRKHSEPAAPGPICPMHFMELSATGVCAICE
ncbi:MAG: hypothetical protein ABJA34_12320 [Pseudonocardiales bacterium]